MSVTAFAFSDTRGHWAEETIQAMTEKGYLSGYPDGTFDPSGSVTLGEALKLVLLAAGYEEQAPAGGHWSSGYAALARTEGLLTAGELAKCEEKIRTRNGGRVE